MPRRKSFFGECLKKIALIITCEHASCALPKEYLKHIPQAVLHSHQGWDIGALLLAQKIASSFHSSVTEGHFSRLLIDLNRSLTNSNLISKYLQYELDEQQQQALIHKYYLPFRQKIAATVTRALEHNQIVLHLSIHSFTRVYKNKTRQTDIGILYDPKRAREANFAKQWQKRLQGHLDTLHIHRNRPYRGYTDGHVSALRASTDNENYLGFELEVCNDLLGQGRQKIDTLLCNSLVGFEHFTGITLL